ncbi:hypothetical protein A3197_17450 [Candidatus Thiodiazotropha endoloripes]|nr:hypothetical protein A3197_17450 [Candidatus Thiodiazotropha endoloripes]
MSQTTPEPVQAIETADFATAEITDAELQSVLERPVPPGADSSSGVIALDDGLSVAPSDADLDYAWRGDAYGLSVSGLEVGPQDLYAIGQVSNEGPGVLAENQASMNDYWLSAQDNAVAQSNPIKYLGAGLMRSLGNIGYGIAEMGVGLWENPGSGGTGAAKAVANFGPEVFNFGINTLKTVLDGYTLLAETAGLPEGSLQSFRESDPFNITPLFSYDSPAESGGALLSGLVSGMAYTKLNRLRSLPNKAILGQADSRPLQIKGSVDDLDIELLRLDGQTIIDNPFLGRVRSQLEKYDINVNYDYGRVGHNKLGETTKYQNGSIEIDIFKQNAFKSQDSLTTYVHESSHGVAAARGREIGTLADEYQAFRREFLFNNGRRPTFSERRNLFDSVQRVYDDVPTGNVAPLFQDLVR